VPGCLLFFCLNHHPGAQAGEAASHAGLPVPMYTPFYVLKYKLFFCPCTHPSPPAVPLLGDAWARAALQVHHSGRHVRWFLDLPCPSDAIPRALCALHPRHRRASTPRGGAPPLTAPGQPAAYRGRGARAPQLAAQGALGPSGARLPSRPRSRG